MKYSFKEKIEEFFSFIGEVFREFSNDNATKLSASLSYYTIFSLAPMLMIVISVASIFLGKEAIEGQLFGQINNLIGNDAAKQVEALIKNAEQSHKSGVAAIIGFVTLLIGATGVFAEIQDSINFIWSLKAKPKNSWVKYLVNRFLSFSLILGLGFLLLISLTINALLSLFDKQLQMYFESSFTIFVFMLVNTLVIWAIITLLFGVIIKVLPDGKISWKDTLIGSGITSLLFMVGKFLIGVYLGQSTVSTAFGAAGSIVLILLWVYYSSIILYFGAEFTKVYSFRYGTPIQPNSNAVFILKQELEVKKQSTISIK
ncbi:YihY/virulence factor BrkB family protein [Arcicella rosea]|uniref:Membrane protein n=1 Tax=Arcicella rosea TaxID=502909 RepID=A0A841EFS6_9BACT|nr:YihY/virulence factor BrkB family protein [Arcicella rosea]MBB6001995.1 membrane protein [Arcicella rosea]